MYGYSFNQDLERLRYYLNKRNTNLVLAVYTAEAVSRSTLRASQDVQAPIPARAVRIQQIILALTHSYVLLFLPLVPSNAHQSIKIRHYIQKHRTQPLSHIAVKLTHLLCKKSLVSMWMYGGGGGGGSMRSSSCKTEQPGSSIIQNQESLRASSQGRYHQRR